jgi:hypothetical protein
MGRDFAISYAGAWNKINGVPGSDLAAFGPAAGSAGPDPFAAGLIASDRGHSVRWAFLGPPWVSPQVVDI